MQASPPATPRRSPFPRLLPSNRSPRRRRIVEIVASPQSRYNIARTVAQAFLRSPLASLVSCPPRPRSPQLPCERHLNLLVGCPGRLAARTCPPDLLPRVFAVLSSSPLLASSPLLRYTSTLRFRLLLQAHKRSTRCLLSRRRCAASFNFALEARVQSFNTCPGTSMRSAAQNLAVDTVSASQACVWPAGAAATPSSGSSSSSLSSVSDASTRPSSVTSLSPLVLDTPLTNEFGELVPKGVATRPSCVLSDDLPSPPPPVLDETVRPTKDNWRDERERPASSRSFSVSAAVPSADRDEPLERTPKRTATTPVAEERGEDGKAKKMRTGVFVYLLHEYVRTIHPGAPVPG